MYERASCLYHLCVCQQTPCVSCVCQQTHDTTHHALRPLRHTPSLAERNQAQNTATRQTYKRVGRGHRCHTCHAVFGTGNTCHTLVGRGNQKFSSAGPCRALLASVLYRSVLYESSLNIKCHGRWDWLYKCKSARVHLYTKSLVYKFTCIQVHFHTRKHSYRCTGIKQNSPVQDSRQKGTAHRGNTVLYVCYQPFPCGAV